jgi:hypothetical protein
MRQACQFQRLYLSQKSIWNLFVLCAPCFIQLLIYSLPDCTHKHACPGCEAMGLPGKSSQVFITFVSIFSRHSIAFTALVELGKNHILYSTPLCPSMEESLFQLTSTSVRFKGKPLTKTLLGGVSLLCSIFFLLLMAVGDILIGRYNGEAGGNPFASMRSMTMSDLCAVKSFFTMHCSPHQDVYSIC